VDLTQPLPSHSKRTKRQLKKLQKKASQPKLRASGRGLLDLPHELLWAILEFLRPSDLFALGRVNKPLRAFILATEARLARAVIKIRYPILERCFPMPVHMANVSPTMQTLLQSPCRPDIQHAHRPQHQNIPRPDAVSVCTCLTCLGRWNALCAVVDFAHWQEHLDHSKALPQIPRGRSPAWNQQLLEGNARVVTNAMTRPLWYARVLEAHLNSTTRSVLRHSQNTADKRRHFQLTAEDLRAGTDAFLHNQGPCEVVYPFARDNYYMLEAFLPGRCWVADHQKWIYVSDGLEWHYADLESLAKLAPPRHSEEEVSSPDLRVAIYESRNLVESTKVLEGKGLELVAPGQILVH
jgi:hypothetical protein